MSRRYAALVSLLAAVVLLSVLAPVLGGPSARSVSTAAPSSTPAASAAPAVVPAAPTAPSVVHLTPSALAARIASAPLPFGATALAPAAAVPAIVGSPVNYSQAAGLLSAAAASTDGFSWWPSAVIGDVVRAPTNFSLADVTSNCTVTWTGSPMSAVPIPATPASATPGTSNAWLSILGNVSASEILLGDVLNGSATIVAKVAIAPGCGVGQMAAPLPTNVVDSPQVVGLANASGGAAFLGSFPASSIQFELSSNGPGPLWLVTYGAPCGAAFEIGILAVNAIPIGVFETTTCNLAYNVTFSETGLAAGTSWTVSVNSTVYFASGPNLTVPVPNGSYPFAVWTTGYTPSPASGTLVVAGASTSQPIAFTLNASTYVVSFSETGLPAGTGWGAVLIGNSSYAFGSSHGTNVSFAVPNGTYAFTVSGPSLYNATPSGGLVLVTGGNGSVPIVFTAVPTFAVTFNETGLPANTPWSVELNTTAGPFFFGYAFNATVTVNVPNGSYVYTPQANNSAFLASPSNGTVVVAGAHAYVNLTFVQSSSVFLVGWHASGLAAGAAWEVLINNVSLLTVNGSNGTVYLSNGSYTWSLLPLFGYAGTPSSGNFSVAGAGTNVSVAFAAAPMYLVTFSETGLPVGAAWYLDAGAVPLTLNTASIAFYMANGTVAFNTGSLLPYWVANPMAGNLTVSGAAASQTIVFTHVVTFPVTFTETGLPVSTLWGVDLNGSLNTSSTVNVSFTVPNGTYGYTVEDVTNYTSNPVSGSVVVNGSGLTLGVTYTLIPANASVVTFNVSGLPAGSPWTVWITNVTNVTVNLSSSGAEAEIALAAGAYNVSATTSVPGFWTNHLVLPIVLLANVNVTEDIAFLAFGQFVVFNETGLPAATQWWANITSGPSANTTGATVAVFLTNGSYAYTLASADARYSAAPGTIVLPNGTGNFTVNVTFSPVLFVVTWTESGLPAGTTWWVNVTGHPSANSTGTHIVLSLLNGTHAYTVATANKSWTSTGGSATVSGAALPVAVTFTLVTFGVTFSQTGLPAGTMWWANVSGGTSLSSTGASAVGALPNGTYTYTIATTDKTYAAAGGGVTVAGASASATVTFTLVTFSVTFTETGLPSGTNWSVTLGASTVYSTGTTLTFTETNGTYSFTVGSVSGYSANSSSGSVHVTGSSAGRTLAFSANPTTSPFLGLPNNEGYYLLGGIVAVLAAIGAGLMLRARGRKPTTPEKPADGAPHDGNGSDSPTESTAKP